MPIHEKSVQTALKKQKSILGDKTFADLGESEKLEWCKLNKAIMEDYWSSFIKAKDARHFEEAAIYFKKALKMDFFTAEEMFDNDLDSINSAENSITFFSDPNENLYMGLRYRLGLGISKNDAMAFQFINAAAQEGLAFARYLLGYCYDLGIGTGIDKTAALKCYQLAAEQGYAVAQRKMGFYCLNSKYVDKDESEAFRWFRLAAEQGDMSGQAKLANCYHKGIGVNKDESEAFRWIRLVAEQGGKFGQNNLACCYLKGIGVNKDESEAFRWFHLAAKQGVAHSQCQLGLFYNAGIHVKEDKIEAFKWFKLSAAQGFGLAQSRLGSCYINGDGVEKDEKEAIKWYRLAAENGHDLSLGNLKKLTSPLARYTVSLLEKNHENLIELVLNDKELLEALFEKDIFYAIKQWGDNDCTIIFLQTLVEAMKNLPENNKNALYINALLSIDKGLNLLQQDTHISLAPVLTTLLKEIKIADTDEEHIIDLMYFLCNIYDKDNAKETLDVLHKLWHRSQSFNHCPMNDSCLNRLIASKIISALFDDRYALAFTVDFSADSLETLFFAYNKKPPLSVEQINLLLNSPLLIESRHLPQNLLPGLKACLLNNNNFDNTKPHYIEKLTGVLQRATASNEEQWQSLYDALSKYAEGILNKQENHALFKSKRTVCDNEKDLLHALFTKNSEKLQRWIDVNTSHEHCVAASSSFSSSSY